MSTSNPIAGRDLETLRTAVTGDVFTPGDHGFDEARRAWNLTTDERPAVVVVAGSAADVARTVAAGGGAQAKIDASYAMFAAGFTPTPELAAAVRAHAQAAKDALAPRHASYDSYNFAETPASASTVLPRDSYHRLQKIKATYDPDQAIIATHPVRPARLLT